MGSGVKTKELPLPRELWERIAPKSQAVRQRMRDG
jgi:hypothetical protein